LASGFFRRANPVAGGHLSGAFEAQILRLADESADCFTKGAKEPHGMSRERNGQSVRPIDAAADHAAKLAEGWMLVGGNKVVNLAVVRAVLAIFPGRWHALTVLCGGDECHCQIRGMDHRVALAAAQY